MSGNRDYVRYKVKIGRKTEDRLGLPLDDMISYLSDIPTGLMANIKGIRAKDKRDDAKDAVEDYMRDIISYLKRVANKSIYGHEYVRMRDISKLDESVRFSLPVVVNSEDSDRGKISTGARHTFTSEDRIAAGV